MGMAVRVEAAGAVVMALTLEAQSLGHLICHAHDERV